MFCNIVVLALQFSLAFSFFYFSPHLLSFSSPPFPFLYVCLSIPPVVPPPYYQFQIFYFCVLLVLHLLFFCLFVFLSLLISLSPPDYLFVSNCILQFLSWLRLNHRKVIKQKSSNQR
jgi:hypothetical protein